jgi:hypothetical protein
MDLVIFSAQGSPYQWTGIGWMKVCGDYTYVFGGAIFNQQGGTMSELESGPKSSTTLHAITAKERWHTLHIQRCIFTDEKAWSKLLKRPNDDDCKVD